MLLKELGTMASALLVSLLTDVEGVRLKPYLDSAGHPTIGVGRLIGGRQVPERITYAQAMEWLDEDAGDALEYVDDLVTVPLAYHERAAVASWIFNLGPDKVRKSETLRLLNSGDKRAFADALLSWNKETVNGVKVENAGLTTRRHKERNLFLTGDWRSSG